MMDRLEEIRKYASPDVIHSDVAFLLERHDTLLAEVGRLQGQLPEGMKDCTILFRECPRGHGWLTATNWAQHGCPTCERDRLKAAHAAEVGRLREALENATKPLLDETDLVAFYKDRMKEHRDNAIASRKRAEAAEKEVGRLREALGRAAAAPCPRDTNGDGDCGRTLCPVCGPDGWRTAAAQALSPQPPKET